MWCLRQKALAVSHPGLSVFSCLTEVNALLDETVERDNPMHYQYIDTCFPALFRLIMLSI